jgi:hypothetical protein
MKLTQSRQRKWGAGEAKELRKVTIFNLDTSVEMDALGLKVYATIRS